MTDALQIVSACISRTLRRRCRCSSLSSAVAGPSSRSSSCVYASRKTLTKICYGSASVVESQVKEKGKNGGRCCVGGWLSRLISILLPVAARSSPSFGLHAAAPCISRALLSTSCVPSLFSSLFLSFLSTSLSTFHASTPVPLCCSPSLSLPFRSLYSHDTRTPSPSLLLPSLPFRSLLSMYTHTISLSTLTISTVSFALCLFSVLFPLQVTAYPECLGVHASWCLIVHAGLGCAAEP